MQKKYVITVFWLTASVWIEAIAMEPAVTAAERAALNDASQKWEKLGASNYSFDYQVLCNCSRAEIARMHLDVSDHTITGAVYAENVYEHLGDRYVQIHSKGSEVPSEVFDNLKTPGRIMQEMIELTSAPLGEYEAEFDAGTGVPCRVYVDLSAGLFDNESELVLSHFEFDDRDSTQLDCAAGESEFVHLHKPITPEYKPAIRK